MNADTIALLQRAADDEAALRWADMPEVPFGQHAQAAIEKLFKALIDTRGQRYPYTHDLETLLVKLTELGESLPPFSVALSKLSSYAMTLRYADDTELPPPLDRRACIDTVERLRVHVLARIQALDASG